MCLWCTRLGSTFKKYVIAPLFMQNACRWYLGVMSRDEVTSVLMKEKGSVFGLRENLDGIPVLSIK